MGNSAYRQRTQRLIRVLWVGCAATSAVGTKTERLFEHTLRHIASVANGESKKMEGWAVERSSWEMIGWKPGGRRLLGKDGLGIGVEWSGLSGWIEWLRLASNCQCLRSARIAATNSGVVRPVRRWMVGGRRRVKVA
jgi:hypothetical protein